MNKGDHKLREIRVVFQKNLLDLPFLPAGENLLFVEDSERKPRLQIK